jgi:transcriptional regulator with XRE-family HTH domain
MPPRKQPVVTAGWGARLFEQRTLLGLTQDDLAEACGVHQTTVGKWELGTRGLRGISPESLCCVAERLGVRVPWLLTGRGPRLITGDDATADQYPRRVAAIAFVRADCVDERSVEHAQALDGPAYARMTAQQWVTLIRAHESTLEDRG